MKSLDSAIKKAKSYSALKNETTYVVFSRDEYDIVGNDYHACKEEDLDTWFLGCEILFCSDEGRESWRS